MMYQAPVDSRWLAAGWIITARTGDYVIGFGGIAFNFYIMPVNAFDDSGVTGVVASAHNAAHVSTPPRV